MRSPEKPDLPTVASSYELLAQICRIFSQMNQDRYSGEAVVGDVTPDGPTAFEGSPTTPEDRVTPTDVMPSGA